MKAIFLNAAAAVALLTASPSGAALVSFTYDGPRFLDPWDHSATLQYDSHFYLDTGVLGRPLVNTVVEWRCEIATCTGDQAAFEIDDGLALPEYRMWGGFFGTIGIASFMMEFDAAGRIVDWYLWSMDDPYSWVSTSSFDGMLNVLVHHPGSGDEIYVDTISDGPGVWYIDGQRASGAFLAPVPPPAALPLALTGVLSLAGVGLMRKGRPDRRAI